MRSKRLALTGVLAVAVIVAVVLIPGSAGAITDGPLLPPVTLEVNTHIAPGSDGTRGIPPIAPEGADPAILESVTPEVEPAGLTILGISAAVIGATSVGAAVGCPSSGMTLEPRPSAQALDTASFPSRVDGGVHETVHIRG